MAQINETGYSIVTSDNPISELLAAPLSPDWTIEALAEHVLGTIATQRLEGHELTLDADAIKDRQSRRLLRPLLACFANKSSAEGGSPVSLYGGQLSFKRSGPEGPVWILGQFENRPGKVSVKLRRSSSPAALLSESAPQGSVLAEAGLQPAPSSPNTGTSLTEERLADPSQLDQTDLAEKRCQAEA